VPPHAVLCRGYNARYDQARTSRGRGGGGRALRGARAGTSPRISAITDEIGNTPEESIAFAHEYGLQFVEIRDRKGPGGGRNTSRCRKP